MNQGNGTEANMSTFSRFLPIFVIVPVVGYLAAAAIPPADVAGKPHFHEFSKLPVMEEGRIKPLDSVARMDLMLLSKRQTFKDGDKKGEPAIKWYLDAITGKADKAEVFRIEDPELLSVLGLKIRPEWFRYSVEDMQPKIGELLRLAKQAEKMKPSQWDPFNRNVMTLSNHLLLYAAMQRDFSPPLLLLIPPDAPGKEWRTLREAVEDAQLNKAADPPTNAYREMLSAYINDDPKNFNKALAGYTSYMHDAYPVECRKAAFETFYNDYAPFYHCSILYVTMFLLSVFSWMVYTRELNRAAFWVGVCTLVFHSAAIVTRMYIQGRPPITNLYSTAIFIGWGCVLLSLLIEGLYQNGIGNLVASIAGSLTTVIAHNLATDGDTMKQLQAVLDTNFWLATHVTIVNFGYAATFVAGILGVIFVAAGVFTTKLDQSLFKSLSQVIYGSVCFGTLLSFTGTVLGGLWADYSWGRFWGWDPKENGALLIVLWNALVLHARWGGLAKQRGVAVLAIFGSIVTAWSWFGVNMLGIGLHAYGEINGGAFWLSVFALSQLILIGIGLIPTRHWRSFGTVAVQPVKERFTPPVDRRSRKELMGSRN
jgi:ABC-type transport system involved in cytochrome c biogenesis permease subunit